MSFRKSSFQDLKQIMQLINGAKEWQKSKGYEQWPSFYPNEEIVSEDIKNGNSYVLEVDNCTIGTFAFVPGVNPMFEKLI